MITGTLACNRDIDQYKGGRSKTGTNHWQPIKILAHSALGNLCFAKTKCTNLIGSHSNSPPQGGGEAVRLRCCRTESHTSLVSLVEAAHLGGSSDEQMGHSPLSFLSQGMISSTNRQKKVGLVGKRGQALCHCKGPVDKHYGGPARPIRNMHVNT